MTRLLHVLARWSRRAIAVSRNERGLIGVMGSLIGASAIQLVRKTVDEGVANSTTLQDDDELKGQLAANEIVAFQAYLHVTGVAAADIKIAFTVPTGATMWWAPFGTVMIDDSGTINGTSVVTGSGSSVSFDTNSRLINIAGYVANGANAGNLQLQFAQVSSNASASSIKIGSSLVMFRE